MDYIIYTIKSHTSLYTYIFVDESPQYIYIRRYDPWLYVPRLRNLLLKLGSKNVKKVLGVWYATSKFTYEACRITYYIYISMFFHTSLCTHTFVDAHPISQKFAEWGRKNSFYVYTFFFAHALHYAPIVFNYIVIYFTGCVRSVIVSIF
jgi:hypothetical protein